MKPPAPCFGSNPGSKLPLRFMRAIVSISALLVPLVVALAQAPSANIPLLAGGTVNLGPLPGEKGVWELSYIENMANYVVALSSRRSCHVWNQVRFTL